LSLAAAQGQQLMSQTPTKLSDRAARNMLSAACLLRVFWCLLGMVVGVGCVECTKQTLEQNLNKKTKLMKKGYSTYVEHWISQRGVRAEDRLVRQVSVARK